MPNLLVLNIADASAFPGGLALLGGGARYGKM
jgi:hypothetical protein